MLHIEITPVGVQRVVVTGDTAAEQDLCLVVWPYIRPHLDRIDRLSGRGTAKPARSTGKGRGRATEASTASSPC